MILRYSNQLRERYSKKHLAGDLGGYHGKCKAIASGSVREVAMSCEMEFDVRTFLQEFQEEPKEIREIFLYVICQTMVRAGLLEFAGVFADEQAGDKTLLYKNPDSDEVFEINKPRISREEELAMQTRIEELLQENAQAA